MLLSDLAQQKKMHEEVGATLQQLIHLQKENPTPPPRIIKLKKDVMIGFKCILKSWKSDVDLVKSSLYRFRDLAEGMWNSCSYILEEWGIREIEESLHTIESLVPNI